MDNKEMIEKVIGSGLFDVPKKDAPYFTWDGCDYCTEIFKRKIGNNVYDVSGYVDLEEAKKGWIHIHKFKLCGGCLNDLYYGEEKHEA